MRIKNLAGSIITTKGDSSERRFGMGEIAETTGIFFDEVGDDLSTSNLKRLTSLSALRVEKKGKDPFDVQQTWTVGILCNRLPRFYPSTDQAFVDRLIVLPFDQVFYASEESRKRYLDLGVDPARLKPAKDKDHLFDNIKGEYPAILQRLITEYMELRDNNGGRPVESAECKRAKIAYRQHNDIMESFFIEYLRRDDQGRVSYDRIKALYHEFVGSEKATTKTITDNLIRSFHFIERKKSNGTRYLVGISEQGNGSNTSNTGDKNDDLPF
jgi:phage/plasmid-associated DNA primase